MSDSPSGSGLDRRRFLGLAGGVAVGTLAAAARAGDSGPSAPGTVLVTGANRGIGLEFVRRYADRGWKTIATARRPGEAADLNALAERSQGRVVVEPLDVTDLAAIDALAEKYRGQAIDVLLNNAGVGGGGDNQIFGRLNYPVFDEVMAVNARGPIKMCEAFLPHVAASAQKKMITVSSSQGSIGSVKMPMLYFYRSSKSAVNMLMANLALQLKGRGIIVGLVTPGATDTDFMKGLPKAMLRPVTDAVEGMLRDIDGFTIERTGQFLDTKGGLLPW
ncbi:MAG: SDR family oxidoreductase [Chromatiales bacterium]|jgi:NAD(P)-dependent dehydrogenase (short-subunit alcohol dehydrogenase family)|nr:SDR family oxidoreductase [Chromatiales bacterium]